MLGIVINIFNVHFYNFLRKKKIPLSFSCKTRTSSHNINKSVIVIVTLHLMIVESTFTFTFILPSLNLLLLSPEWTKGVWIIDVHPCYLWMDWLPLDNGRWIQCIECSIIYSEEDECLGKSWKDDSFDGVFSSTSLPSIQYTTHTKFPFWQIIFIDGNYSWQGRERNKNRLKYTRVRVMYALHSLFIFRERELS